MAGLYDKPALYDLFEDERKYNGMKRHWAALLEGKNIHSLLDVSIGTGGLTLPLAELGVQLYGSDLSEAMLEECRHKAEQRGLPVDLRPCDFRALGDRFRETFDCVASTGNSLPYVPNDEVLAVLAQMDARVKEGGYLYWDMRNWDKILRERKRFYLYDPVLDGGTRVHLTQVWDYNPDGTMTFNLLYTFEREEKLVNVERFEEHYYPVSRALLLDKLRELGYQRLEVRCHPAYVTGADVDEIDWYCVLAQKGTR